MSEPTQFGVQSSMLHECIHVGRINKARTAFLEKVDGTDMVLYAVAQYVLDNFGDENGGAMETTFPKRGVRLRVEVDQEEPEDR